MATSHGQQAGITIDASTALTKLARMGSALTVRDILEGIGAKELRWTGMMLDAAGKVPEGLPWQHMAPLTLRRRPVRQSPFHFSSPYQTLLRQSMTTRVDEASASVSIGTNAPHAIEHHLGVPARNLPARRLLATPAVARKHALEFIRAVVDQLVAGLKS
jgi:phage gpG-like protein